MNIQYFSIWQHKRYHRRFPLFLSLFLLLSVFIPKYCGADAVSDVLGDNTMCELEFYKSFTDFALYGDEMRSITNTELNDFIAANPIEAHRLKLDIGSINIIYRDKSNRVHFPSVGKYILLPELFDINITTNGALLKLCEYHNLIGEVVNQNCYVYDYNNNILLNIPILPSYYSLIVTNTGYYIWTIKENTDEEFPGVIGLEVYNPSVLKIFDFDLNSITDDIFIHIIYSDNMNDRIFFESYCTNKTVGESITLPDPFNFDIECGKVSIITYNISNNTFFTKIVSNDIDTMPPILIANSNYIGDFIIQKIHEQNYFALFNKDWNKICVFNNRALNGVLSIKVSDFGNWIFARYHHNDDEEYLIYKIISRM